MSIFTAEKGHMREPLLFCFRLKRSVTKFHGLLVAVYGDRSTSKMTCRDCSGHFNEVNFDLTDSQRENRLRNAEDSDLHALLS